MARAYIAVDWLEASSIGMNGSYITVPFIIEIDAAGDDPYTPWLIAAPFGTPIPGLTRSLYSRFGGLVAKEYSFPRLLNEKTYRGEVTYGPLSDRTIGLWRRSVRFASETRQMDWSLPEFDDNGNYTAGGTPKLIGTNVYDFDRPFRAASGSDPGNPADPSGDYLAGTIEVRPTGSFEHANVSVNDGITSIVYQILVSQLTRRQVRTLSSYKWHTNKYPFLDYPTWSLIFANFEVDDEVLVLPGSRPVPVWHSNVTIEILHRDTDKALHPHGWRAFDLYDSFSVHGGRVPVTRPENGNQVPIKHTFVRYPQARFTDIFDAVGGGLPGI